MLPKVFSDLHPKFNTPYKSNIVLCIFISLFAGLVPISIVGEMTSIGTLLAFVMVCIGILILRNAYDIMPLGKRDSNSSKRTKSEAPGSANTGGFF